MREKQLFVKPMFINQNITTGEQMEKKDILKLAIEYGDVKYGLATLTAKRVYEDEINEEEYIKLHKRRMELLNKLYEVCLKN